MAHSIVRDFGRRLRDERKRLGYTQEAFATLLGINRMSQFLYEKETYSPTIKYLGALEDNEVNMAYLLGFDEEDQYGVEQIGYKAVEKIFNIVDRLSQDSKEALSADTRTKIFMMLFKAAAGKKDIDAEFEAMESSLKAVV